MSEWAETTLGRVIEQAVTAVPVISETTYPIVGVLNRGRGLLYRDAIAGGDTSYKTLNRIGPNQIVYSRLKAFEGAITVTPAELTEAYASQEFPTFTCGPTLLPDFFRLLTTTTRMWQSLQSLSTGMGGRRERVKPADFLTMTIALPSLAEQQRIVDVMETVDAQVEALLTEVEKADRARAALLDALLTEASAKWTDKSLGAVGTFVRGRRFTKSDYVESGLGCIHYGQIYTHYGPLARQAITFLPEDFRDRMRLAQRGDLVIAATGEDPVMVGKAMAWLGDDAVAVHDDAQIFRHALEPRYAAYVMAANAFQMQKRRLVSDMKVARVSSKDLAGIYVPVPPREHQTRIADVIEGLDKERDALSSELERLRMFRSAMLVSLLNQDVEIPESYDAMLEAVS